MVKTFEVFKDIKLNKNSQKLWLDHSGKTRLCIMTSKSHSSSKLYPPSSSLKYWFTLTKSAKDFLDNAQTGYVFLGFLDDNQ